MEKVLRVINDVISNPPIPHEPYKQSLKKLGNVLFTRERIYCGLCAEG